MGRTGFNPAGAKIKTDSGVDFVRGLLCRFTVTAANAVAASAAGVGTATLTAEAQTKTTGITNPAVPRNITVVGNVSGITGNVVVNGKSYTSQVISETFALNGATPVVGAKAFKTITSVVLPAQTHTPTAQVETFAVTAGCDADGTLEVTVTAAGMTNSPKTVYVDVTTTDNETSEVATKIRAALTADTNIGGFFTVGGSGANIVLTAKTKAANDATLALSASGDTGVTIGASGNTTAGVAGTLQVETVTVTAGSGGVGNLTVRVTAGNMTNSPKDVTVAVTGDDNEASEVATKVKAALALDADVNGFFTISGEGADIVLTAKTKAANDANMAIALQAADGTGVTFGASSNTTTGVAPVCQVETVAITAGAARPGKIYVTLTAAGMSGSPVTVTTTLVATDDTVEEVAAKVRTALAANTNVDAFFTVGGAGANVSVTAKTAAANDGTLAFTLNSDTGVTFGASGDTTAGIDYDIVSIGWGDKLGLPYKLDYNSVIPGMTMLGKVREGSEPTVTVSATAIESNTLDLNSALNGTQVDAFLIVTQ